MQFKLASWNINAGIKFNRQTNQNEGPEDIDYFIEQLAKLDADIVCLQETHINKNRDLAREIAKSMSYEYSSSIATSISHLDPNYSLGMSIISKFPFQESKLIQFPNPQFDLCFKSGEKAPDHKKYIQRVSIGEITIANTQLLPIDIFGHEYSKGKGLKFAMQIEEKMLQLEEPIIFSGDFNINEPDKLFQSFFSKIHLVDLLPEKITIPLVEKQKNKPDHIYYSDHFKVIESGVLDTNTDHLLCYSVFETALL